MAFELDGLFVRGTDHDGDEDAKHASGLVSDLSADHDDDDDDDDKKHHALVSHLSEGHEDDEEDDHKKHH